MLHFFQKVFINFSLLFFAATSAAQDTILLMNPSFEDIPRRGGDLYENSKIKGWIDCGLHMFSNQTPPDIHPTKNAAWGVIMPAHDKSTYLGLVVRFDGSFESLSQKLITSLKAGHCYSMSLYLARYSVYNSPTQRSPEPERFTNPVSLRIWGGDEFCERKELLMESGPVENNDWQKYDFRFLTKNDIASITFEAYFMSHIKEAYNGHVLMDNISPIIGMNCNK